MDYAVMSDKTILKELGDRLRQQRLNQNITQMELAKKADVGLSKIKRMEQGQNYTISGLLRIMRALDLLSQLDNFLPNPGISPIQLARLQGRQRQRASGEKESANHGEY